MEKFTMKSAVAFGVHTIKFNSERDEERGIEFTENRIWITWCLIQKLKLATENSKKRIKNALHLLFVDAKHFDWLTKWNSNLYHL